MSTRLIRYTQNGQPLRDCPSCSHPLYGSNGGVVLEVRDHDTPIVRSTLDHMGRVVDIHSFIEKNLVTKVACLTCINVLKSMTGVTETSTMNAFIKPKHKTQVTLSQLVQVAQRIDNKTPDENGIMPEPDTQLVEDLSTYFTDVGVLIIDDVTPKAA